jgi:hypothetical protein
MLTTVQKEHTSSTTRKTYTKTEAKSPKACIFSPLFQPSSLAVEKPPGDGATSLIRCLPCKRKKVKEFIKIHSWPLVGSSLAIYFVLTETFSTTRFFSLRLLNDPYLTAKR